MDVLHKGFLISHSHFCWLKFSCFFQVKNNEPQSLVFTIPIFEPLPSQYLVHAISDRWIGAESVCAISFKHLMLPEKHPPHTDLLDLQPLPLTALKNPFYEQLFQFSHFNPVQTQVFHTLYHTDHNVLLGAPTGSGKTIAAELAIFRVFNQYKNKKVKSYYILSGVRDTPWILEWNVEFQGRLKRPCMLILALCIFFQKWHNNTIWL